MKPWDNERTPTVDAVILHERATIGQCKKLEGACSAYTAESFRDMERRARHAEGLLRACWLAGEITRQRDIIAHIHAAAQEDVR